MVKTKNKRLPKRTRAVLASFAANARALAEACERAAQGKATPADQELIRAAWDLGGKGKSQYVSRPLAITQSAETGVDSDCWAYMMEFFGVELVTIQI